MQITIVSAGKIIPASELISATLRTDLVPIPASIEFTVQSTTELARYMGLVYHYLLFKQVEN
ncbi:hypothetical protein ACG93W_15100 [Acinetobacter baumannii]|uniref:hypothetical protein n=1 Tax=Acinetobacter baumannii TaxID=470 RepID=UPI003AF5E198